MNEISSFQQVSPWILIPFILVLITIAVFPLLKSTAKWWENIFNKFLIVSVILSLPVVVYFIRKDMADALFEQVVYDYIPFISLIFSLFVVTGGIFISSNIKPRPIVNTMILAIGYVLASIMGTTGAAMLLIRPLLSINKSRKNVVHTICFFIAAAGNCGGLLTPLGDPPLFILYLRGTPFTWFLHLLPEWAFTGALILLIYFVIDTFFYSKEKMMTNIRNEPKKSHFILKGSINFIFLAAIILSIAFINSHFIKSYSENTLKLIQSGVLVFIALLSFIFTKKTIRYLDNQFSWRPVLEVAFIFIGIFITMTPALIFLKDNALKIGITEPWQFYYSTGMLSSFLDNTPTGLAFYSVATGLNINEVNMVAGIPASLLKAISIGAVFFGAMTYIGNGPNFMIKSIAEGSGVKMPDFFRYMYRFSLIILLPVYVVTQIVFL